VRRLHPRSGPYGEVMNREQEDLSGFVHLDSARPRDGRQN
jgi:hypothetical protein